MATNNWIDFNGTGLWNTAANWSLDRVPAGMDDVVFDSGTIGTGYTVAGNGTADALNVFGDNVTITGGTGELANADNALSGTINDDSNLVLGNAMAGRVVDHRLSARSDGAVDGRWHGNAEQHRHRVLHRRFDRHGRRHGRQTHPDK